MEQRDHSAHFPVVVSDWKRGKLELIFAIGREQFRDLYAALGERGANTLDCVAIADDLKQWGSRRDSTGRILFFESRITQTNTPGRIDHEQTISECGEDRTHFSSVGRDPAVELALANQYPLEGQPRPAGLGRAA